VLAGFVVAALAQLILGPRLAAIGIAIVGTLWLMRTRRAPAHGIAVPAGLLIATAGIYSGYSALNAPFGGVLSRFSVAVLLILIGAVLLFADQDWQFQSVVLALAAIAFVVVHVVLRSEEARPIPAAGAVEHGSGIIGEMEMVQVVRSFVDAINAHDAAAVVALTTPDHRFIDSLGNTIAAEKLRAAWDGYFQMVPDYRITVTRYVPDGTTVLAYGTAAGSYERKPWSTPAAWRAVIRDRKVAEWQVYADNEPIRGLMRGGAR
jgi:ketosteroid isomerase-like protein